MPNRVPSTAETTSQCSASPSPKPPAAAPWSTIPATATSASKSAAPASRSEILERVLGAACPSPTTSISVPPPTRRSSRKSSARTIENSTDTDVGVPSLEHLRRHSRRVRTGSADVEDEGARDGMTVGRHDTPGRGVRATGEPPVERDSCFPVARTLHVAGVDAACPCVIDADRAEGRLDRFVEPEQHRPRALLEHRVVRRLSCDQPRVRTGHRHQHERHQHGGDRGKHRPARTRACVYLHLSSLMVSGRDRPPLLG